MTAGMKRCVLFDMDGTLVDSYSGISASYAWAFRQSGLPFPGDVFVRKAIGAPLPWVFEQLCGMDAARAERAVGYYRSYYAQKGKFGAAVYRGMESTLIRLKQAGCFLGTATLKKEAFALEILERLRLLPLFDLVCGMDERDSLTKAGLLRRCMETLRVLPEETVLVGDSLFDRQGAEEAGVDFLAVTYGFGFRTPEEQKQLPAGMTAASAKEIADILLASDGEKGAGVK